MPDRIHYTNCPVCGSADIIDVLKAKDHTVSGETFTIAECRSCSLRFTQDVPDAMAIAPYYKSEDYISHTNTSKGLINRMYKYVRGRTMKKKRRLVERITGIKKGKLLDLGSGVGSFVNEMKQHGWEVTGLEPDPDARAVAKQEYAIALDDLDAFYRLPRESYDAITLWHVLEHVHDLHGYMQQLQGLLKQKGTLFIAVPNYTSQDASVYREYWAGYDVPRHLYHFSPNAMRVLLEKHNLRLLRYQPMWYDSFYVSLLSSKYKKGKPEMVPAFWNGLRSNLGAIGNVKKCSSVIYVVNRQS